MGLFDEEITYEYNCTECPYADHVCTTLAEHAKIEQCPKCNGKLTFVATDYNVSNVIDTKQPKTLGALAEKNREKRTKRGQNTKSDVRQKLRDFDIVKDNKKAERYIATGKK